MIAGLIKYYPQKDYWLMTFPFYGTFVYYGTDIEAQIFFEKRVIWEGGGSYRKANPFIKKDFELVNQEIDAVKEDRASGIKIPTLPKSGGF